MAGGACARRRLCRVSLDRRYRPERGGDRRRLLAARALPRRKAANAGGAARPRRELSSRRSASAGAPACLHHAHPGGVDDRAGARRHAPAAAAARPSRAHGPLGQSSWQLRPRPGADRPSRARVSPRRRSKRPARGHAVLGLLLAFRLAHQSFSLDFIGEWHSTDFTRFQPLEIWILGLLVLGFWLRPRLPWTRLVLLVGLVHMALTHSRNADLLALIGPILLAQPVGQALGGKTPSHAAPCRDRRVYLLGAAAAALLTLVAWIEPVVPHDQRVAPSDALAAAAAAGITGPVFNAYDFGGYLVFAGVAPFVDGR